MKRTISTQTYTDTVQKATSSRIDQPHQCRIQQVLSQQTFANGHRTAKGSTPFLRPFFVASPTLVMNCPTRWNREENPKAIKPNRNPLMRVSKHSRTRDAGLEGSPQHSPCSGKLTVIGRSHPHICFNHYFVSAPAHTTTGSCVWEANFVAVMLRSLPCSSAAVWKQDRTEGKECSPFVSVFLFLCVLFALPSVRKCPRMQYRARN